MNSLAIQTLLREQLALSQGKNPAYSVGAFARRLDLGLGTVSEELAGKRTLADQCCDTHSLFRM